MMLSSHAPRIRAQFVDGLYGQYGLRNGVEDVDDRLSSLEQLIELGAFP